MRSEIHVGFINAFIFLGIFQGLILSWFFIKNSGENRKANLFQGLLLLSLSLAIFEEWLNNTGYIVKILSLTNFSEPLNFVFGVLFYMYVRSSLSQEENRRVWLHFIPFIFWIFYMVFPFIQSEEMKYNAYVETKHPEWPYLDYVMKISDDPLGLRRFVNQMTLIQLIIYVSASLVMFFRKLKAAGQSLFATENGHLVAIRNTIIHFVVLLILFLVTKVYFGMRSDVGGYIVAAYVSFMIFSTSFTILNRSDFFESPGSFFTFPSLKYQKSALSEERKEEILSKITREMEENTYFTKNLASLSGLSKQINESTHHVSQVINEKMSKSFFEMLAYYRVEYAKKLIAKDKDGKITVEELAEMAGYNSKSPLNAAFKKYTSQTPSEFRKSLKR